jgi:exosortase
VGKGQKKSMMIGSLYKKYQDEISTLALVLLAYTPTFLWMWDRWFARDSYYSHGILIPFISFYLIWNKKDELKRIPRESSPWGFYIFLLGVLLHLLSAAFRVYFSSGFSLIVMLLGLVLHFFGRRVLNHVLFPIIFLAFMVPLPIVTIAQISFKLKLFAAQLATAILNNNLRIPCFQDGSTIRLQHTQVIVDDVCSGLRSLISLTALGSIFAYWIKGGFVKKSIVFLATIPIAVVTNAMRIVFLAAVSEIWGAQYATGFLHDLSGFIVFAGAFILLFFIVKLLE